MSDETSAATRTAAHNAVRHLATTEQALETSQQAVTTAATRHQQVAADAHAARATHAQARAAADAALRRRSNHHAIKPGVLEILFTVGKAVRRWHAEDEQLAAASAAAEATATHAENTARQAEATVADAAQKLSHTTAQHDSLREQLAAMRAAIERARREHGELVPDGDWWTDETRRELAGPWLDETWNAARTRVFLAALRLHAAFAAGAARILRGNLTAAMDVLRGNVPPDTPEPAVRAAWQSLFLVVPVVSTTFASVSRLFAHVGREALGWLLIDEAGQAAPQMAAGAIWRARRVVAVGDPLQLEPVVTVLHTTQQALRGHHGVTETWLPGRTSVQILADRITTIGTELPGPDQWPVWVGAPLRVHRRCDNPMFDVVNTAVYGGLMIHGTPRRNDPLPVEGSAWIDVASSDADGNWIPAEGNAAREIFNYLLRCDVDPSQIMVISPFRDGARALEALFKNKHQNLTCGTVHRAQGKESDIVLFILGGNPAKPGARGWAALRPNLLNVAVSRAKQRLYVVGNHDAWSKLNYFSTLAHALPVRPLKGGGDRT